MTDFDIWGTQKKKKNQAAPNVFSSGLDFGLNPKRGKTKDPLDVGIGLGQSSEKTKYERVPLTSGQKFAVLARQKDKCAWPGCNLHFHRDGITPHFDHIKRVDKGGPSSITNIQALCPNHHQKKTSKENVKEVEKTRKKPKKKEKESLFGGGNIFGAPLKRSKNNVFGF